MKQKSRSRKKRIIIILLSIVLCTALVMTGLMIYGKSQMAKVPGLTFREALEYTTRGKKDAVRDSYGFDYSNYGYAVLGLVIESVYGTDYTALVNDYVQNDLGLISTKISEHDGDLENLWDWEANDAYLSAGALTSNIADMLTYAQMQLNDPRFAPCHLCSIMKAPPMRTAPENT